MEPSAGRRIHAGLALRDWTFERLAEEIDKHGYGARTLRKLAGQRALDDEQVAVLARALELPVSFFSADVTAIYDQEPDQLERIERCLVENSETLARINAAVEELTAQLATQLVAIARLEAAADRVSRAQGREGSTGT